MRLRIRALLLGALFFPIAFKTSSAAGLTVQLGGAPEAPTLLVQHSDTWRYHKGSTAPQADWKTAADSNLDASWLSGAGGIGYQTTHRKLRFARRY